MFPARKPVAQARGNQGEDRREHPFISNDDLRKDMERQSLQVRDFILAQQPVQLLGYLWTQFHMGLLADLREKEEDCTANKALIRTFQFALEYVHAVWSCHAQLVDEKTPLDKSKAGALIDALKVLENTTIMYCMVSSAANTIEFHAKTAWVLIRGHRYQVLEKEFFTFVLEPHANALRATYGMEFDAIAAGIQAITDTIRTGVREAAQKIQKGMEQTYGPAAAIEKLKEGDGNFAAEMSGAMHDLFCGGICNLSRHTNFTSPLLEDLSYLPGGNTEFFADGDFKGTPMRSIPALIKPGIKLGDEYYVTDGQFVRDALYRTIQRGLLRRSPAYHEEWNRRQKALIEQSYPTIFSRQLAGSTKYSEVFFKNPKTGQWVETDLVMPVGDVLLVVEAKAGVMAMYSPATNFDRHVRAIRELIINAYEQCKRFTEYLSSTPEVLLYNRIDGEYVEIGRLRQRNFRTILPIGLTVEAFTPFSAMSKDLAEIQPLLGKHPFISMSVDDLFVLNRFLPTTGELFHYLEVRQQAAGIPNAMLFGEIDHLGAYIANNRFDMSIKDQLKEADMVVWDSFSDVIDKHFEGETWRTASVPHQEYPEELTAVLSALDKYRPAGWLEMDAHIRNLNGSGRNNLAEIIMELKATLPDHPIRRFLFGDENPMQVWLCRSGIVPPPQEMRYHGEVSCLTVNAPRVVVLRLSYNGKGGITDLACTSFANPPVIQTNYTDLKREAERQRARLVEFNKRKRSRGKHRQVRDCTGSRRESLSGNAYRKVLKSSARLDADAAPIPGTPRV